MNENDLPYCLYTDNFLGDKHLNMRIPILV